MPTGNHPCEVVRRCLKCKAEQPSEHHDWEVIDFRQDDWTHGFEVKRCKRCGEEIGEEEWGFYTGL